MTTGVRILENDGRVQVTASGGQTSLAFDFPIYDEAHIRIIRTRSGADTTLALTTDYTVPSGSIGVEAGGVVTLNAGATAGDIYTLLLDVPYARTTDFIQAGDFLTETLNQELDLLTQQNQQIVRNITRSAKLPESSTISSLELPAPQPSKIIGWNNLGTAMTNYAQTDLSGTTVSAFIETLLDDPDAATARATLGISGGTVNNFSATTAPTVNEDSGDGYVVGSEWIDVTNDRLYICLDNTLGAAVWLHQVDTTSTQTLTNKTLTTPTINQGNLVGTTTNDDAAAGSVGEYKEATLASGSATSLTTATAKTVISVSLEAGDWDVWGTVYFTTGGTTSTSAVAVGISTTNNTFPSDPDSSINQYNGMTVTNHFFRMPTGSKRLKLASTTTVYLVASSNFTTSTTTAYGIICARRRR